MCVRIYNRDTGQEAESPQELRDMLGCHDLKLEMAHGHSEIAEDCCLCQIDCEATAKREGYTYTKINGDYMDVEISKAPNGRDQRPGEQDA